MTRRKSDTPDEARARERAYREKNREKRRDQSRAHYDRFRTIERVRSLEKQRARRERLGPMTDRDYALRSRYGITNEEFNAMLSAQGGTCAICFLPPLGDDPLHVDHDHRTGLVRALLCGPCNRGLGKFRDSAALCRRAADYLDKHGAVERPREKKNQTKSKDTIDRTGVLF